MKHLRNLTAAAAFGLLSVGRATAVKLFAITALVIAAFALPDTVGASVAAAAPVLLMGNVLDVFKGDAFSLLQLTQSFNRQPFVPGRAGQLIDWNPQGITSLTVLIEEENGVLTIINPSPRGGVGDTVDFDKRAVRALVVPHYQRNDGILADQVQGVREFGTESQLRTVESLVNQRLAKHARDFDLTIEYQRVGAIKGIVVNGNGNTLMNLFTEFQVSQEAEVAFDLTNASTTKLRKTCATVTRTVSDNMGGEPFFGIHAICGDAFFDDLLANPGVVATYPATEMARVLRDGYVYPHNQQKIYGAFAFGDIVFENYKGTVNGSKIVETDKCHLFPMGTPDLFKTVYAPADYMETVNTVGLPRYAKQFVWPNDKGVSLEVQTNSLSYCTRPKVLMKGKRGA